MSASKEKRTRTDERQTGVDKKIAKNKKLEAQKKRTKRVALIVAIVLVVLIAAAVVINTGALYGMPAISVGGTSYDVTEFNYQYFSTYYTTYNELYNSLGSYIGYILNPKLSLSSQTCAYDSTKNWEQYFTEQATNNLKNVTAIYSAAKAVGYTLDDDAKTEIEDTITSLKKNAETSGYVSFKKYLVANYGKGMTEAKFRQNLEREAVVSHYAQSIYDSYEYTSDEIKAYYEEHKNEYDLSTYYYYFADGAEIKADADKGIEAVDAETAMANAKALADKIAAATSGEEFTALVKATLAEGETEPTIFVKNATPSRLGSDYSEWMLSADRKEGDTTVIKNTAGNGYYVLRYVSRNGNDYAVKNVRHILVKFTDSTDAEKKAADLKEAEDLYASWKAGEATEDSFAKLATEKSDDTAEGGLIESVYLGRTVEPFENWCFDAERKAGDTGIIESTYGYHIMYYVGEGELYCDMIGETAKRNEQYNAWVDGMTKDYTVTESFGMRLAR